jgi:hypothetical protein
MSAANTFTEETLDTPVAKQVQVAMLLHEALFEPSGLDTVADGDFVSLQLTKSTQSGHLDLSYDEVVSKFRREFSLVTSGMVVYDKPMRRIFSRPQLYGKSKIYLGMITAGQAAAKTGHVAIGYTLNQVAAMRMYDALTD